LSKILVFTLTNDQEDVGSRMDEGELTKVRTQGIKKKKTQLRQLVTASVLVFWSRFWVFWPFQVCSQTNKKATVFFWCVKRNDTVMKLLFLSLKSQQKSIKKF